MVRVFGRDFHGVAVGGVIFYYRYDSTQVWSAVLLGDRPPFVYAVTDGGKGSAFQWAVAITMTNTQPIRRPVVTRIEADFQITADSPHVIPQRVISTVQRG